MVPSLHQALTGGTPHANQFKVGWVMSCLVPRKHKNPREGQDSYLTSSIFCCCCSGSWGEECSFLRLLWALNARFCTRTSHISLHLSLHFLSTAESLPGSYSADYWDLHTYSDAHELIVCQLSLCLSFLSEVKILLISHTDTVRTAVS